MNRNQKIALTQTLVVGAVFLGLPALIRDTGSGMLLMLIVIPLFCLCLSFLSAWKNGFGWRVPLLCAGWFLCSVPVFYNKTALPYAVMFFLLACLGQMLGAALRR